MADVDISWDGGLDRMLQIVDPVRFVAVIDDAIGRAASVLRDEVKRMPPVSARTTGYAALGIPVNTGRLRQSIQARKLGTLEAVIFADTNYSLAVHEGSNGTPARPFFRWQLENFGGLQMLDILLRNAMERVVNP